MPLVLVLWWGFGGAAVADGGWRPNLLFVFSDQQSSDMLGCYGNDQIITPRIDACAAAGVLFRHCVSSCPVCTPYRGMLLSGQHPLGNGCLVNDVQMLPAGRTHFAEVLRDAGYQVGYVGKWHLHGGRRDRPVPAGPLRYGFDTEFFTNNCSLAFSARDAFFWNDDGRRVPLGRWEPDGQTDQALAFIDRHAGRPFALFVSWHPPHDWAGGYEAPANCAPRYDEVRIRLRPGCADTPRSRREYRGYMALCTNLDGNFGRLLDKLDELDLAADTLVVYTSDHGDILRSHGIQDWHKSRPEHVSARVPLILRWPGRLPSRASETLVGTLDLMPTLLGLLGISAPATCQGDDLSAGVLAGRDEPREEGVPLFFWGEGSDWRGVYTRRHTYAFEPPGGTRGINVLYDRRDDPDELENLFARPAHRGLRDQLHTLTLRWMARFGDEHVRWDELRRRIYVDPAAAAAAWAPTEAASAALRGRPIDLLAAPR